MVGVPIQDNRAGRVPPLKKKRTDGYFGQSNYSFSLEGIAYVHEDSPGKPLIENPENPSLDKLLQVVEAIGERYQIREAYAGESWNRRRKLYEIREKEEFPYFALEFHPKTNAGLISFEIQRDKEGYPKGCFHYRVIFDGNVPLFIAEKIGNELARILFSELKLLGNNTEYGFSNR